MKILLDKLHSHKLLHIIQQTIITAELREGTIFTRHDSASLVGIVLLFSLPPYL